MSSRHEDEFARPYINSATEEVAAREKTGKRSNHSEEVTARFWEKVQVDEAGQCWPWIASKDEAGYGRFWLDKKTVGAHRLAYELTNGPIACGHQVMHACDNPTCCNPRHLSAGTAKDNSDDKVAKGRQACGENHGRVKLTNANVSAILASKAPLAELASLYHVSKSVVSSIRRRRHRRGHWHAGEGNG